MCHAKISYNSALQCRILVDPDCIKFLTFGKSQKISNPKFKGCRVPKGNGHKGCYRQKTMLSWCSPARQVWIFSLNYSEWLLKFIVHALSVHISELSHSNICRSAAGNGQRGWVTKQLVCIHYTRPVVVAWIQSKIRISILFCSKKWNNRCNGVLQSIVKVRSYFAHFITEGRDASVHTTGTN